MCVCMKCSVYGSASALVHKWSWLPSMRCVCVCASYVYTGRVSSFFLHFLICFFELIVFIVLLWFGLWWMCCVYTHMWPLCNLAWSSSESATFSSCGVRLFLLSNHGYCRLRSKGHSFVCCAVFLLRFDCLLCCLRMFSSVSSVNLCCAFLVDFAFQFDIIFSLFMFLCFLCDDYTALRACDSLHFHPYRHSSWLVASCTREGSVSLLIQNTYPLAKIRQASVRFSRHGLAASLSIPLYSVWLHVNVITIKSSNVPRVHDAWES